MNAHERAVDRLNAELDAEPVERAEVWCEKCPEPATDTVTTASGERSLCGKHASNLRYTITCPGFRGGRSSK